MGNITNKQLVPFTGSKPLVPGSKGGRLGYWRQERARPAQNDEIMDMAQVIRRLSQELVEQILFLQDPNRKSPEQTRRALSRMLGALKQESSTLSRLFQIEDLHPALKKLFLDRVADPPQPEIDDNLLALNIDSKFRIDHPKPQPEIDDNLLALPTVPALNKPKPTIFHLLTDRELEFVTYLLAGHTITEAAGKMGCTAHTGHVHRSNVIAKAKQVLGAKGETDDGNS